MTDYMPEFSWWYVKAKHRVTKEVKSGFVKFTGPFPIEAELNFYCPPDVCIIQEMRFLWNDEWTDKSQEHLYEELKQRLFELHEKEDNE